MKTKGTSIKKDWILTPEDMAHVINKNRRNRLSFAWMFIFYKIHSRFPNSVAEIHPNTIDMIAQQLNVPVPKGEPTR